MAILGYARVSTSTQAREGYSLQDQKDRLKTAGATRVFDDALSGKDRQRPGLEALLGHLRPDDVVLLVKLDRLGRSLSDLSSLLREIEETGATLRTLDGLDTGTAQGRLLFGVLASIAEFEREMILERTAIGRARAAELGKTGGSPSVVNEALVRRAAELHGNPSLTAGEAARALGVSRATFYRLLRASGGKPNDCPFDSR